jgi:hypothetical protein
LVLGVSVIGLVGCTVVVVLSFISVVPPTPGPLVACLFVGMFPICMHALVKTIINRQNEDPSRASWLDQPGASRFVLTHYWWLPLVLIGGTVAFISGGAMMTGQSTVVEHTLGRDRVFTSVPGLVYAIGLALNIKTPDVPSLRRNRGPR